ncbi:MAG: hypothetical protein K2K91_10745 [Ruminococcus sp.]|nr:hypothetical protein [Ruminococcus sp.]MDE7099502.1 hypothetical protein [Ruminococcus sp.]
MNNFFVAMGIVGVLTYCFPTMQASAVSNDVKIGYTDEVEPRTEGLIHDCEISVSNRNGELCINGSTISNSIMKTIGIKDIVVERSTDNENWSYYKPLDDMLESKSSSKYVKNYTTSVDGGYYYRITCNHYAKVSTFGSSQTVGNTSNSIWIS